MLIHRALCEDLGGGLQWVAGRVIGQSELLAILWLEKLRAEAYNLTFSKSHGWELEGPKLSGPRSNG